MIKTFLKELFELLKLFFQVYTPVIGITWIFSLIYLRLFLKRNTYSLDDIKIELSFYFVIICIVFLIIQLIILFGTLFSFYRLIYKKTPSKYVIAILDKINLVCNTIYWQPLEFVYQQIAPNIPGSGRFFIYLESRWTKKKYDIFYFRSLIFLFDILPKISLALIFLVEIVILNQIKIFPYCIGIILIPICFNLFIKLLLTFSIDNLNIIKQYFSEIEGVGEPTAYDEDGSPIDYPQYRFHVKPEYESVVTHDDLLLVLQFYHLQRYAINLKQDLKQASPYVSIMTSLIYIFGGSYRISFILS